MCSAGADSTRLKAGKRPNASTIECVRPLRRVDAFEGWQPGVLSRSFSKTLCRAAAERWGVWRLALLQPQQTAGLNALNNRGQWPECLVPAAAEGFRGLRPGKRQAWTPFTTEGSGLSAWSQLPRRVLGVWGLANGRLERPSQQRAVAWVPGPSCRGGFLRPGKRQAWTPLTTEGSGLSAWSKLLRRVLGVLGVLRLANGRLERP